MDEENSERGTPPIFLTFDTEEPGDRVLVVTPDSSYLNTPSGFLKVIQMALSLVFLICVITSGFISEITGICFGIIAIGGFCATSALLASYLVGMEKNHPDFPWLKTELISSSILTFYNIAVVATIAFESNDSGGPLLFVGAFFSLGSSFVYGINAWQKYIEYRKAESRRMNRTISSISVSYQHLVHQRY